MDGPDERFMMKTQRAGGGGVLNKQTDREHRLIGVHPVRFGSLDRPSGPGKAQQDTILKRNLCY